MVNFAIFLGLCQGFTKGALKDLAKAIMCQGLVKLMASC